MIPDPEVEDELLTIEETMARLKISRTTYHNLRRRGRLEIVRLGYKTARVKKSSVDKLIREGGR